MSGSVKYISRDVSFEYFLLEGVKPAIMWNLEDLPGALKGRGGWRERDKELCAISTVWWGGGEGGRGGGGERSHWLWSKNVKDRIFSEQHNFSGVHVQMWWMYDIRVLKSKSHKKPKDWVDEIYRCNKLTGFTRKNGPAENVTLLLEVGGTAWFKHTDKINNNPRQRSHHPLKSMLDG